MQIIRDRYVFFAFSSSCGRSKAGEKCIRKEADVGGALSSSFYPLISNKTTSIRKQSLLIQPGPVPGPTKLPILDFNHRRSSKLELPNHGIQVASRWLLSSRKARRMAVQIPRVPKTPSTLLEVRLCWQELLVPPPQERRLGRHDLQHQHHQREGTGATITVTLFPGLCYLRAEIWKLQQSSSGSEHHKHTLREIFLLLTDFTECFGKGCTQSPKHTGSICMPQEQAKPNKVWLLRFWLQNIAGKGRGGKKKSFDGKPLLFAHKAKKLELQIWRMQDKLNFLSSPELLV